MNADKIPQAEVVAKARGPWWVYALPALTLIAVLIYLFTAMGGNGPLIHLRFDQGHGIAVGNPLKHRGITAGLVESVTLDDGMEGVTVGVRLKAHAADLAREDSRFWIVRPEFGFSGVGGLETLLGPKTIGVLPGGGSRQYAFIGETQPPILERMTPGGTELILQSRRRGSLSPGSPIQYRQVTIGRILEVALASDGSAVEARAYIQPEYSGIIRDNSVFWNSSGIRIDIGLGVEVSAESLETLVAGGVAVATPDQPGDQVASGTRFTLASEFDEDWLDWRPSLTTSSGLPVGTESLPMPWSASLAWNEGRLWTSERTRSGWVLPLPEGILGPTDLLSGPTKAHEGSVVLSVKDTEVEVATEATKDRLTLLFRRPAGQPLAPQSLRRGITAAEDVTLVRPDKEPQALAAARQTLHENGLWRCQDLNLDPSWHGAPAVATADNRVVGVLILNRSTWFVVALP